MTGQIPHKNFDFLPPSYDEQGILILKACRPRVSLPQPWPPHHQFPHANLRNCHLRPCPSSRGRISAIARATANENAGLLPQNLVFHCFLAPDFFLQLRSRATASSFFRFFTSKLGLFESLVSEIDSRCLGNLSRDAHPALTGCPAAGLKEHTLLSASCSLVRLRRH